MAGLDAPGVERAIAEIWAAQRPARPVGVVGAR